MCEESYISYDIQIIYYEFSIKQGMNMVDETDKKIIEKLEENSRRAFTDIADDLGISEATVRNRVKALEEKGIIKKYTIEMDPSGLGYDTVAIIGIDIEPENLLEVSNMLSEFDRVKFVATSAGDHMIMFEAWAENNEDLGKFISEEIGEIEGVKNICPAIILEKVKY